MAAPAADRDLPTLVLDRITGAFQSARDPQRARAMARYMRDRFAFLGIPAPRQRLLARRALDSTPRPTQTDVLDVADACWRLPEREYQYFACSYLRRYVRLCGPDALHPVRDLVTDKPWWDTADVLAAHVVGPLAVRHPALVAELDSWALSHDPWLVRVALLHQLRRREATDVERLFRYCTDQSTNPDFFVRKAVGWALRDYAGTDPAAVRRYVAAHRGRMSPLSVREALRTIGPLERLAPVMPHEPLRP